MRFLYLIPGLACLFIGGVFLLVFQKSRGGQEAKERRFTGRAWARLVDTESRTEHDINKRAHTVYYGVYAFDTADGQQVTSASDFGYHSERGIPGAQGNQVKICYDPQNPADFALPEEQAITADILPKLRKVGIGLTALGILLLLAAAAILLGLLPLLSEL